MYIATPLTKAVIKLLMEYLTLILVVSVAITTRGLAKDQTDYCYNNSDRYHMEIEYGKCYTCDPETCVTTLGPCRLSLKESTSDNQTLIIKH